MQPGLQHETKCKEFKMSQRVPATAKIKGLTNKFAIWCHSELVSESMYYI